MSPAQERRAKPARRAPRRVPPRAARLVQRRGGTPEWPSTPGHSRNPRRSYHRDSVPRTDWEHCPGRPRCQRRCPVGG
eukprot:11542991-Alexandrium_andersonii.AAC.1